jgi:hypothetical protein
MLTGSSTRRQQTQWVAGSSPAPVDAIEHRTTALQPHTTASFGV